MYISPTEGGLATSPFPGRLRAAVGLCRQDRPRTPCQRGSRINVPSAEKPCQRKNFSFFLALQAGGACGTGISEPAKWLTGLDKSTWVEQGRSGFKLNRCAPRSMRPHGFRLGLGRTIGDRRLFRRFRFWHVLQGDLEHVVDPAHRLDVERALDVLGDLRQILLVLLR